MGTPGSDRIRFSLYGVNFLLRTLLRVPLTIYAIDKSVRDLDR